MTATSARKPRIEIAMIVVVTVVQRKITGASGMRERTALEDGDSFC